MKVSATLSLALASAIAGVGMAKYSRSGSNLPRFADHALASRDLGPGMCDQSTPCVNGACCSKQGNCGYSPDFCGAGNCTSNCDAKAECGQYAAAGKEKCSLNVCCSEFGFCGYTEEFCGEGCQSGCGQPTKPSCDKSDAPFNRAIGYYESWANGRTCQKVAPEDLNVDGFTHINFGFLMFDPKSFAIAASDDASKGLFTRFTNLKNKNPNLQAWVSIGGWSFNDPGPTATAFSDMVKTKDSRTKFISELVAFMKSYAFDGVDLDWEYPADSDRGGALEDKANYVALAKEIKAALGKSFGLSMTLPMSYYYLKLFDIDAMQKSVDFFNVMSYDIHGIWGKSSTGPGPYIRPHTNLTEIDEGLDLMWRAGVDPRRINLGLAWYGRSFTLKDEKCSTPNGICEFVDAGIPGECTKVPGTLNLQEIVDIGIKQAVVPTLDPVAGVQHMTWNKTQWVSFDDASTMKLKQEFANSRCLGGAMVWAMDQAIQTDIVGLSKAVRTVREEPKNRILNDLDSTTDCNGGGGQWLEVPEKRGLLRHWTRQSNPDCDALSQKYGLPTGSLQVLIGDKSCKMTKRICVPKPCKLIPVTGVPTCENLAKTVGGNVTVTLLKAWNPSLLGSCDKLTGGQQVCVAPYGGWYPLAAPPLKADSGTDTSKPSSVSGGATGSTPLPEPLGASSLVPTSAPAAGSSSESSAGQPHKTISGFASNCNSFAAATSGDMCSAFAVAHSITPWQLYRWNMGLGSAGKACETAFQAGSDYCVGTGSAIVSSTGIASSTGASSLSASPALSTTGSLTSPAGSALASRSPTSGPHKTQSGVADDCNSFAAATSGDACSAFAVAHSIKPEQLYSWNLVLGANGKACPTAFQAGEEYCVGTGTATVSPTGTMPAFGDAASASSSVVSASSSMISAPGSMNSAPSGTAPASSGMASAQPSAPFANTTDTAPGSSSPSGPAGTCSALAMSNPGDTLDGFLKAQNLKLEQLFWMNPVIREDSEGFLAGFGYCIGTSGAVATGTGAIGASSSPSSPAAQTNTPQTSTRTAHSMSTISVTSTVTVQRARSGPSESGTSSLQTSTSPLSFTTFGAAAARDIAWTDPPPHTSSEPPLPTTNPQPPSPSDPPPPGASWSDPSPADASWDDPPPDRVASATSAPAR